MLHSPHMEIEITNSAAFSPKLVMFQFYTQTIEVFTQNLTATKLGSYLSIGPDF